MAAENKFLVHLNLNGNEIRNVVLQNLSSAPEVETGTNIGRMYYDTTEKTPKIFNGTEWISFGNTGGGGEFEDTNTTYSFSIIEKNANGNKEIYLHWENSDKESGDILIVTIDGEVSDTSTNPIQNKIIKNYVDTTAGTTLASAKEYADGLVTKAMNYKGTITLSSGLPTESVKIGDTYKVAEAGTYAGQAAKVGDIFIASSTTPTWDYIPSGDETEVIVYTATNPTLTATSGGVCEWSITTTAASKNSIQSVAVYENSTNEQVYPNITISGNTNPTIKITIGAAVGTTITANTYTARYIY